jgi:hypothetical protein
MRKFKAGDKVILEGKLYTATTWQTGIYMSMFPIKVGDTAFTEKGYQYLTNPNRGKRIYHTTWFNRLRAKLGLI